MCALYKHQVSEPRQWPWRQAAIFASAVLISLSGCTPTRPTVSGKTPEVATSQEHSAESTSTSAPPASPPAATQPQQTQSMQSSAAAVSASAIKSNASPTVKAAESQSSAKAQTSSARSVAKVTVPAVSPPPAVPAVPAVPATPVAKPTGVAIAAEKKPATSTLDLKSLEQQLRETRAIGVFTKLSLKNQVDDLLDQFRDFYKGKIKTQLSELRQRYNLLLMKVLSLLQDSDAALASAIVASREAIWDILKDPQKFAQI